MGRLRVGDTVEAAEFTTISGAKAAVPSTDARVHLQFRRFAACPICNLHLRAFAQRHNEITAAGVTEVVFFHSPADSLTGYQADLPFAVVADPDRVHYDRFGVEVGVRAMDPRAWSAAARGVANMILHRNDPTVAGLGFGDGSTHLGLPADFLIDTDGKVAAAHYGRHADDQWSVDELLELNRA